MSDDPTHRLDGYRDDHKWVVFCKVCSAEGDLLAEPCPGKYVSPLERKNIDTTGEHK